jgi:hypothetical protein
LRKAVALGYDDFDWISQDPDLEALQTHPEYQRILSQLQPKS